MAKALELVMRNVCDLVSPPTKANFEIVPLSLEQIQKLLVVARGKPIEMLVTFALATGMRRGELLGLKWHDIDFEKGVLQVRRTMGRIPRKFRKEGQGVYAESAPKTKTGRRSIIVVLFALEALKQHRQRQQEVKKQVGEAWKENDLVFCTSVGMPMHPTHQVLDPFKALLQEAQLPNMRFHDLRHSAATLLLSMDVHPKIVQEILGHSNISITLNVYSHVLPNMQKDAMEKLNNAFESLERGEQELDE